MLGWIYFIASCYIVSFVAKCIYKSINHIIEKILKAFKSLKYFEIKKRDVTSEAAPPQEVTEHVH